MTFRTKGLTRSPPISKFALCLQLQVKHDSFLGKSFEREALCLDLKVDVFYNGEHTAYKYICERAKHSSNSQDLTQRVTGRRCQRRAEYPWILNVDNIPPTRHRDGAAAKLAAQAHWADIANQILREADRCRESSELSSYLRELAKMAVPLSLSNGHVPRDRDFGVIDVVITEGRGKKFGPREGYM